MSLPPTDPRYVDGAPGSRVPSVSGLSQDTARTAAAKKPVSRSPTRPRRSTVQPRTAPSWARRRAVRPCPGRSSRSRSATASRRHHRRHRRAHPHRFRVSTADHPSWGRRSSRFPACRPSPFRCWLHRRHRRDGYDFDTTLAQLTARGWQYSAYMAAVSSVLKTSALAAAGSAALAVGYATADRAQRLRRARGDHAGADAGLHSAAGAAPQ